MSAGGAYRLLYIDDQPKEDMLRHRLGREFSVSVCTGLEELEKALAESPFPYEVALVDYRLGNAFAPKYEDGLAVTRRLLQRSPETDVVGLSWFLEPSIGGGSEPVVAEWVLAGARWYCDGATLSSEESFGRTRDVLRACADRARVLRRKLQLEPSVDLGAYVGLEDTLGVLDRIARLPVPVLLVGETGTGKELLAQRLHDRSGRKGSFVIGNCAQLRGELAEIMLHGQEFHHNDPRAPGFPRPGWFERAEGGTVFLDELGEMPRDAQASLLRVLQERRVRRVLGTAEIPVDFRLIGATNRPLEQQLGAGSFRPDLYFRVAVFPVHVPALGDRRGDIPALAHHFLEKYTGRFNRSMEFTGDVIKYLRERRYPGNVRELESLVQRIVALAPDSRPSVKTVRALDVLSVSPHGLEAGAVAEIDERGAYAVALVAWMNEHIGQLWEPHGFRSKTSFVRAAINGVARTHAVRIGIPKTPAHVLEVLVKRADPVLYARVNAGRQGGKVE